ncbi:hypothetical protein DE146DRAFT_666557 [Phaeosphaeria sp. MPI-PUGE-AT-0046c]|nr:hypothetical protein DE146DRAFT_666557 [Phaeosphaeria sp. MPI-PUGE-AT-0046c]
MRDYNGNDTDSIWSTCLNQYVFRFPSASFSEIFSRVIFRIPMCQICVTIHVQMIHDPVPAMVEKYEDSCSIVFSVYNVLMLISMHIFLLMKIAFGTEMVVFLLLLPLLNFFRTQK